MTHSRALEQLEALAEELDNTTPFPETHKSMARTVRECIAALAVPDKPLKHSPANAVS